MSQLRPASIMESGSVGGKIVNDFCITFSTVNGSGSATANTIILKSLFRMGIPVNGKNIFPSNIQGLPTWYSIRLSKKGYLARVEMDHIVVAMNPATLATEMQFLVPGGVLFYPDDFKVDLGREDVILYPMPVKRLIKEADAPQNLRDYMANMVYVGVVAQMLGIDLGIIYQVLDAHFKGKKKAVESNWSVIQAAANWAKENLEKRDPYYVEPMPPMEGYIITEGNVASALGALYGGVQLTAWYPITPASSLAESVMEYLPQLRTDPETGKTTCVVIQAEDEIAAIGMAVGAGWAGLRAMTSTSGPGISLMAEYLGLAYYAEVPVVVWDVQRVGPSTGLPTRTAQGDLTFVNFISHGDTEYVILLPGNVKECFEFGWKSFDIAERLQTPVIILSDLDLGMNYHISPRFEYPDQPMDRGKVLWEEDLEKMLQKLDGKWGRYLDVDGDGIPYRTLPGNRHPASAYFARGTGHDEMTRYSEDPDVWERGLNRLKRKIHNNLHLLPEPVIERMEGAKFAIIGFGSTDPAIQEARDLLAEAGFPTDYMRIRSLPFRNEVGGFLEQYDHAYVVELNRDGQLKQLLTINFPESGSRLRQVSHVDGMPMTAKWIVERILSMEDK
ncbi:MAG: 2-oxoacid:acceptor oxidoreductase subunit alpha [Chloroflexota bacterium]